MNAPLIGITCDFENERFMLRPEYVDRVREAGGVPVLLPPLGAGPEAWLDTLDGFVLTGGDDPHMDAFQEAQHPASNPMDRRRQVGELGLVRALLERRDIPVLAICLGMQFMGLLRGARLIQHLPDVLEDASRHEDDFAHPVESTLGNGLVASRHHQALADGGTAEVIGRSPDGVIEAIRIPEAEWQIGVQWHPERTADPVLGTGLFRELVTRAARRQKTRLEAAPPAV